MKEVKELLKSYESNLKTLNELLKKFKKEEKFELAIRKTEAAIKGLEFIIKNGINKE